MIMQRIIETVKRPKIRWALVALLVYTTTTLILLYPAPLHLSSVIIGEERSDAYGYIWSLWWAKRALLDPDKGQIHLTLMNHPVGIKHPFLLTMISVPFLALPFSLLFPPVLTYNLQILLSFILSGMTMYWLCVDLTRDRRAGLVGGFIFAFFLNKTGHVIGGHLPQVTTYLFPLYVLLLHLTIQRPRWPTALLTALVLAVASLVHAMHLAYLLAPVTLAVLLISVLERRAAFFTRQRLVSLALVFGLAALMAAPFLLPTVLEATGDTSYLQKTGTINASTDLLAFFTPSQYHPVLGPLGLLPSYAERVFRSPEYLRERLAYPGILVAGLALWGLFKGNRRTWVWGTLALTAAVLSLGPLLKVGEELVRYQVDGHESYVVLPYALLKQLPVMNIGRTSGRLNETTMFATAILAAYGTAEMASKLARRPRPLSLLLAIMLVGIGFEYIAIWPFPVTAAEPPPTIRAIDSESGDGALLYLGTTRSEINHRALYYQIATQQPIVGGRLHRTLPEVAPWRETLSRLAEPEQGKGDIVPRPGAVDRLAWLHRFDVDYVLFFHAKWWGDDSNLAYLEDLLGPPRYDDPTLAAFVVPDETLPPDGTHLYTFSVEGWHGPEQDGGQWRRWMCNDGQIYLYADHQEVGSLRFTLDSHLEFPALEVYQDGQRLDGLLLDRRQTYTTRPFTLTQGMNVFRFHLPDGSNVVVDNARCWQEALSAPPEADSSIPCRPEDVPLTCRTVVFDHITFVPQSELSPGEALDVNLGDQVRLRGWALEEDETTLRPGSTMTMTLTWEPKVMLNDQVVAFVHLVAEDGMLVAQHDGPLVAHVPSPSAWPPGIAFGFPVTLDLPADLSPGDYRLLAGVYLWPSLERLPVLDDVPGAEMNVIELGNVRR